MSEEFIYYKDIGDDDVDLKLKLAKDFYDRVDDSCKYIESKSQKILTAVLTILALIGTFYSALINGSNNSQTFKHVFAHTHILLNIILCIILTVICLAGIFVSRAFNTNTVYYIGKNSILGLNIDKKKQLIEKYLNYAKTNLSIQQEKQSCFKKSLICFKIGIFSLFIYILSITKFINLEEAEVFLLMVYSWLKLHLLLITLLLIFLGLIYYILHCKLKHYEDMSNIQKIRENAYYKSLKYPQNTQLENWIMAYDEFYMTQHIIKRRGFIYKLKLNISNIISKLFKEYKKQG
ncbi:MAG: hypothetical protein ACI4S3_02645 [Candidatus Gastranaerophilaceae bacterium]